MRYWLFQANPKYSQILQAIAELEQIHWLVTRYFQHITPGDGVLVWVAGKRAGVYAIAQVIEPPQFLDAPPELAYWTTPTRAMSRFYAPVQLTHKLLERPLLKAEAYVDPILRSLEVLRAPHNTNFRVTAEQWARVQTLIEG
jgi:EVE domain